VFVRTFGAAFLRTFVRRVRLTASIFDCGRWWCVILLKRGGFYSENPMRKARSKGTVYTRHQQKTGTYLLYSFDKGKGGHKPPHLIRELGKETMY
jgi:hypothetical protein